MVKNMKLLINRNGFIKVSIPFLIKILLRFLVINQRAKYLHIKFDKLHECNKRNKLLYPWSSYAIPVILNQLSINFSCVEDEINNKYFNVVLMTPKSPVLYNYISTHGNLLINDKKYKKLVKEYCSFGEKYHYDNGYWYEDLSLSHLIELIGENTFEARHNVILIYYFKKDGAKKLVDLELVEIPKYHKLNDSKNNDKYSGYNERDFIISMLQTVKIYLNINFREIINHDLKVENINLFLEKDTNYIFEIKVLISDIINDIKNIKNKQTRFINSLKKNVKINDIFLNKKRISNQFLCAIIIQSKSEIQQ